MNPGLIFFIHAAPGLGVGLGCLLACLFLWPRKRKAKPATPEELAAILRPAFGPRLYK